MTTAILPPYQLTRFNGLQAYRFDVLKGTRNAVFARTGGDSPHPWHSLNLGHAVGDDSQRVHSNFAKACRMLNIDPAQTASCHLVHGNTVLPVTKAGLQLQQADGLITRQPDLVLTMRFADCTPLLFFDPVTRSVGLAHAGWRGTMQNVMGAVVQSMGANFGVNPADLRVVIGPCIGPCCYQVGEDVRSAAEAAFADSGLLFAVDERGMYFDMPQANAIQAKLAGVKHLTVSGLCTACNTDQFFSHRAEKGKTGRFGAFLGLAAEGT